MKTKQELAAEQAAFWNGPGKSRRDEVTLFPVD